MKNPRILITNDDGIHAEGLAVLERIAAQISDDVWVVAPEQEQSGASHSLTIHVPVRVREISEKRYATTGTPTDCVLLAVKKILKQGDKPFDLLLSGVNRGGNAADDISYSGTVAGAIEGTVIGIPSIALSQFFYDGMEIHWGTAEHFAPEIIRKLLGEGWPNGSFINLNFPACAADQVKGTVCAPQGKRMMNVGVHPREDLRGRPYYWIGGARDDDTERDDVDIARLVDGYVTITPVQLDRTDYPTLQRLNGLFKD